MSKEIKEILNKLLEYFKESNINDFGYEKDKLISYEEAQILLNYITNLQKEKDNYKQRNEKAVEYIKENTDKLKTTRIPKIDFNYNELLKILEGGDE